MRAIDRNDWTTSAAPFCSRFTIHPKWVSNTSLTTTKYKNEKISLHASLERCSEAFLLGTSDIASLILIKKRLRTRYIPLQFWSSNVNKLLHPKQTPSHNTQLEQASPSLHERWLRYFRDTLLYRIQKGVEFAPYCSLSCLPFASKTITPRFSLLLVKAWRYSPITRRCAVHL